MAQPRTDPLLPQNYRFSPSVDYGRKTAGNSRRLRRKTAGNGWRWWMGGGGGLLCCFFALRCCFVLCWMRQARRKKLSVRDAHGTSSSSNGRGSAEARKRRSDVRHRSRIEKDKKKSKSRGVVESNPRPSTAYYYSSYTFQVPSCAAEQQVLQR